MINLLPPETKQELGYARRNSRLLRWGAIIFCCILGAWLIIFGGLFYTQNSIKSYTKQSVAAKDQLQSQKLEETQAKVQDISNHLKLVVQVLSKEILFSKLLQQIGSAIPPKSILTDLKITKLEGGIDLTAIASDEFTATQVQVNLQDPSNKIFDKVDIVNITCASTSTSDPRYPCTVTLRARFNKNNPFLFINPKATTGAKP